MDNEEVKKFSVRADEWWDPKGSFKVLHKLNNLRFKYIDNIVKKHHVQSVSVLDIGCGGGILSEILAKDPFYQVTAIDPSQENINVAESHKGDLLIDYKATTIENYQTDKNFDVICIMEVVEHVSDLSSFLSCAITHLKTGGMLFFSTINKTIQAFLEAIIVGEYLFGLLPKNTHQWSKFVRPSTLSRALMQDNCMVKELSGIRYNILINDWGLKRNSIGTNYIGYALHNS